MQRFLYLVFFALMAGLSFGAGHKSVHQKPAVLREDSASAITVRTLDTAAIRAYSKQPEFKYKEDAVAPTLWTRFWRWFWNWIRRVFKSTSPKKGGSVSAFWNVFFKYLFLVLGIVAVVFLVFRLVGVDMQNVFRRRPKAVPVPYSEFFEDINAIRFDEEIEHALAKHNYRLAVRLLYLKCLKQLSDAGLIEWQIDKTNSDYVNELANADQRSAFRFLTRQFEYVWYGEFLIDRPVYNDISGSFHDFNKHVA
ncbi:MAG: DUF4129 domain-containing protein [Bacteroidetes bacterium]|nr:DUF4129 domain-containing protein [Bacteroidota bacterium]